MKTSTEKGCKYLIDIITFFLSLYKNLDLFDIN